jgi:hypothetical protein
MAQDNPEEIGRRLLEVEAQVESHDLRLKLLAEKQEDSENFIHKLDRRALRDSRELSINTQATMVFLGGVLVMVLMLFLLNSRFTYGSYEYRVDPMFLEVVGLPAIGALVTALSSVFVGIAKKSNSRD